MGGERTHAVRRRSLALCIAGLVLALFGLVDSSAYAERQMLGARAVALGGALRASAAGTAGPILNPAAMSLTRTYVMGAIYQYRGADGAHQLHFSIVDSLTSRIAAGIFYGYSRARPQQTLSVQPALPFTETFATHEAGLSLSAPLGEMLMIGVTGKYLRHRSSLPEGVQLEATSINTGTVDVGGVFRLAKFRLAVVGKNLVAIDDPAFARTLGLGLAVDLGKLLLGFDSALDFSSADRVKASYHGGAEIFLARAYAIRLGVEHDTLYERSHISFGGALIGPKIGLECGIRQTVAGGVETQVATALKLYMR
ncbi:MAG: hypothetical protein H6707_15040 [Deltaproteobacteria bacterium]|nr:hypothetical protein [Deltaproteobacteria bacterium]